jgi:hypothetical protein
VDTIAAGTVLISFNWPKGTVRYERTEKFVNVFFSKFSEFYKKRQRFKVQWVKINLRWIEALRRSSILFC